MTAEPETQNSTRDWRRVVCPNDPQVHRAWDGKSWTVCYQVWDLVLDRTSRRQLCAICARGTQS
jgi:hypothetical protein